MSSVGEQLLSRLRERRSAKWRTYPDDVIPLPLAEMDFDLAEPVSACLLAAIERSDTGYAPPSSRLPEALSEFAERRWQWQIRPEHVRVVPDVCVGIVDVLRATIRTGQPVAVSPPVFPPFFDWVAEAGGTVAEVPLRHDGSDWSIDLDGLETAFASGVRAYLLCNPHNPVGLLPSARDLARLAELAATYDVLVLADEIHAPLTLPGATFTPFLQVSDEAREHGLSFMSASKGWNLAGLKCATVVAAHPTTAATVDALPGTSHFRTGHLGALAAIAAYESAEDWLDATVDKLAHNRDLLSALLQRLLPEIGYEPSAATYFAWLDFTQLGWGPDPAARILREARVALSPGPEFGSQGRGWARLNLGCAPELLHEAVDRIALQQQA